MLSILKSGKWFSAAAVGFVCFLLLIASGCRTRYSPAPLNGFRNQYAMLSQEMESREALKVQDKRDLLTVTVEDMPLTAFVRWLAQRYDVSIVVAQRLEQSRVTLDLQNETLENALSTLARRVNAELSRSGNLYFLGDLRSEDLGVLVRRAYRLDQDGVTNAIKVLLSERGQVQAFPDGVVVVGDRVEVLRRVSDMLDAVSELPAVTWCVQLYLVSMSDSDLRELGLDVTPAVEIAATMSAASGNVAGLASGLADGVALSGALSAVLQAVDQRDGAKLVAEPLFVLVDGETGKFSRGERIPVAQRTVSDQGTVSTTGFEQVQTGLVVEVAVREVGPRLCRLRVDVELSDVTGVNEGAPSVSAESFQTRADVVSGGVYLLGSLERVESDRSAAWWLKWGGRDERGRDVLQVWARAYRIAVDPDAQHEAPAAGKAKNERAGGWSEVDADDL